MESQLAIQDETARGGAIIHHRISAMIVEFHSLINIECVDGCPALANGSSH